MFHAEPHLQDPVANSVFYALFSTFPEIDFVIFEPQQEQTDFFPISTIFEKQKSETGRELFILSRDAICPKLSIRLGVVEDSDDLAPLLELKNLTTMETKGEFFLADLLHNQDEFNYILIGMVFCSVTMFTLQGWRRVGWINVCIIKKNRFCKIGSIISS